MQKITIKLEYNDEIHKLPKLPASFSVLLSALEETFKGKLPPKFILKYKDIDNDMITLSDDHDYQTALSFLQCENIRSFKIIIQAVASNIEGNDVQISKIHEENKEKNSEVQEKPKEKNSDVQENLNEMKEKKDKVQEKPNEVLEKINEVEESNEVQEKPSEIKENSNEIQEKVNEIQAQEKPISEIEKPQSEIKEKLVEENQQIPIEINEKPLEIPEKPLEIPEKPVEIPEKPVEIPENPVENMEKPVEILEKPVEIQEKPVEIQEKPVEIAENMEVLPEKKVIENEQRNEKADSTDFTDLENIVKALQNKMIDSFSNVKKNEPHPIDLDMKTIVEELTGEKEENADKLPENPEVLPFGKPAYPNLQEENQVPEKMELFEEKKQTELTKSNEKENISEEKQEKIEVKGEKMEKDPKKKEKKEYKRKKETIELMKEFFTYFVESQTSFQLPCYRCQKDKNAIFSFSCKKCNNAGFFKVDTTMPKYSVFNQIIKEKFNAASTKFAASLKKKKTSIMQNVMYLQNPYFCVACRSFPIKGKQYICETCVNFAFCKSCHETQIHPHVMHEAFYEEDVKKREKIFSLKNLGPQKELSPKPKKEEKLKAQLIKMNPQSSNVEPLKNFAFTVIIKNNGNKNWPKKVKLECVEGIFKGVFEEAAGTNVGEETTFVVELQAGKNNGRFENKWRLAFDNNQERKYFGPKITHELVIASKVGEEKPQPGVTWKNPNDLPKGNQVVIENAEKLKNLIGGDVKVCFDFILKNKLEKSTIDQICDAWFSSQGN